MRTLVLSPDFGACLCWHDEEGCGLADEQVFPLTDDTRRQLHEYYLWWSELFNSDSVVSMTDWRLLDERGFEIWQRLLAELGTANHVHFYSHRGYKEIRVSGQREDN